MSSIGSRIVSEVVDRGSERGLQEVAKRNNATSPTTEGQIQKTKDEKAKQRKRRKIVGAQAQTKVREREASSRQALQEATLYRGDRHVSRGMAARLGGDSVTSRRRLTV